MDGEDRSSIISLRFSHTTNPVTRYPKLWRSHIRQLCCTTRIRIVTRHGFTAYGVDVFYTGPYVLRRVCCLEPKWDRTINDLRVGECGTDRKATSSSAWEELGRAGFQDYIDVYTQTAYDCYRVVNSISRKSRHHRSTNVDVAPCTERSRATFVYWIAHGRIR
jgi:hypothetical protein